MGVDRDYFAEEKVGTMTDANLIQRMAPFIRPYMRHLAAAVLLILIVTLIDLAIPYVTKVAIDQYIVPVAVTETQGEGSPGTSTDGKTRIIEVDLSDPAVKAIVTKYRDHFFFRNGQAGIRLADLTNLAPADIAVLRKTDLAGIARMTLIFIVLIAAGLVASFFQQMMLEYTGQVIMHDLRMQLFTHIQSLSVAFFTKNAVGRLVTRVTNDVQNMNELFTAVIVFVFKDLFLLVGICIVLVGIDWQLALICFIVLPIVVLASFYFARQAREAYRTLRLKVAEINSRLSETINGMRVIQLFRQEAASEEKFKRLNHENYLAGMQQMHVFAIFMPFVGMLSTVALAVVIYFGGARVLDERITLGVLVAFTSYIRMFFRPIRDIAEKYNILQNALSSAERLFVVLDSADKMPESIKEKWVEAQAGKKDAGKNYPNQKNEGALETVRIRRVAFDRITFGYTPDTPVLENIQLEINRGERVAVVGPTGSGKTSLINLLVRFYDPSDGQVLINDRPLATYDIAALRQSMALVTQDPFLFTGTIAENIRFGNPSLSDDDLMNVITNAHCSELVAKLPGGLAFVLAGGKEALSSGERQLISIARAFARDPDLLILDEATSYIDSVTEEAIQNALERLMHSRTTLLVAHRLSTAREAHRIVVLSRGRIIESGTHDELIDQKGFYYRLDQLQN